MKATLPLRSTRNFSKFQLMAATAGLACSLRKV
jgi:hypothetical protein